MKLIKYFRLLLLGMWLGAAVFLSAVLAPSAFLVLRGYQSFNASEIAGAIVNRNLIALNLAGFVIGLIVFVTGLFRFRKVPLPAFLVEMICAATLAVATAIGHWVIAAKLRALRLTLTGPIDQLTATDPRRMTFDRLHSHSVKALVVAMIAAFVGFVMVALRTRKDAR